MTTNLHLQLATRHICHGGVIAYPTEAVFGLGCDPLNEEAVGRVLAIKGRPVEKGLILLAADLDQLLPYIMLRAQDAAYLREAWPVGVSYLLPATDQVPAWIRGRHTKVAVRVSSHPLASALARLAGTPIVSTSANLAGMPAARNVLQVRKQLGEQLDFILNGDCDISTRPSKIIDFETGTIIRS